MRGAHVTLFFVFITFLSAYITLVPVPSVFSNNDFEKAYFASSDWIDLVGERTRIGNFDLYSVGTISSISESSIVYIWGDSHAEQYFPRVTYLLKRNERISATFIRQRGCPPIMSLQHDNEIINYRYRECDAVLADLFKQTTFPAKSKALVASFCWACLLIPSNINQGLTEPEEPFFIINGERVNLFSEQGRNQFFSGFIEMFLRLGESSGQLYVFLGNPVGEHFNPLNQGHLGHKRVAVGSEQVELNNFLYKSLSDNDRIEVVNLLGELCDEMNMCLREHLSGSPIYKDSDHLNASFIRDYASWLDQVFL